MSAENSIVGAIASLIDGESAVAHTVAFPCTHTLPAIAFFYQLAIPAPPAPDGSYDKAAAARGDALFTGKARCASCHVPPLFTEPGHNLHAPADIGVDSFQADRSPTRGYRTAPLKGLWTHQKGGFTTMAASLRCATFLRTTTSSSSWGCLSPRRLNSVNT